MPRSLSGPAFQVFSVLLVLVQALVAPYVLGLNDFGEQILLLLPVFLAQAVVEPALQAHFNGLGREWDGAIDIAVIGLLAAIACAVFAATAIFIQQDLGLGVFLALVAFFLNTVFQSRAFALGDGDLVAVCAFFLLLAYGIGFALGYWWIGSNPLVLANAVGFGTSFTVFLASSLSRRTLAVGLSRPSPGALLIGLFFRLPTLVITNVFVVLLSRFGGTAAEIGAFRIVLSALNAGRYFNLISLPRLQVALHRSLSEDRDPDSVDTVKTYLLCVAAYLVALTLLFPGLFEIAFGEPPFGSLVVVFCGLFVVIQPLTYGIATQQSQTSHRPIAIFLLTSVLSTIAFSSFINAGVSAFIALAVIIPTVVAVLSLIFILSARAPR